MAKLSKKQLIKELESWYKDAFEDAVINKGLEVDDAKSIAMMGLKIYAEEKYGVKV